MAKKSNGINAIKVNDDWAVENDLRTMMEAEAIEKDPKRLAKVKALAKQKMLDIAAVASGAEKT